MVNAHASASPSFEGNGRPRGSSQPRQVVAPVPAAGLKPCVCGHGREAHQHYRRGKDCALCSCARYHRPLLTRLFH